MNKQPFYADAHLIVKHRETWINLDPIVIENIVLKKCEKLYGKKNVVAVEFVFGKTIEDNQLLVTLAGLEPTQQDYIKIANFIKEELITQYSADNLEVSIEAYDGQWGDPAELM